PPALGDARRIADRDLDTGERAGDAALLPARSPPPPRAARHWAAQRDDRAADVGRVKVRLGDVVELDVEHLADPERPRAGAGAVEVVDLEHEHVAAVAPTALEPAPGRRPRCRWGDDLEERVAEREDDVSQSEVRDPGIGE